MVHVTTYETVEGCVTEDTGGTGPRRREEQNVYSFDPKEGVRYLWSTRDRLPSVLKSSTSLASPTPTGTEVLRVKMSLCFVFLQ